MFGQELASEREPRNLGAIFLSNGLTVGAEAQKRPAFTSTELHIAMLYESPEDINKIGDYKGV